MGTTNNIKETNITLQLAGKTCDQCSQKFTQREIDERNWDIYFDTTNDVKLTNLAQIKAEKTSHFSHSQGRFYVYHLNKKHWTSRLSRNKSRKSCIILSTIIII